MKLIQYGLISLILGTATITNAETLTKNLSQDNDRS